MKYLLIEENGISIEYEVMYEQYVVWCDECECYHFRPSAFDYFDLGYDQTEKLIKAIKDNQKSINL